MCPTSSCPLWEECVPGCSVDLRLCHLDFVRLCLPSPDSCWSIVLHLLLLHLVCDERLVFLGFIS